MSISRLTDKWQLLSAEEVEIIEKEIITQTQEYIRNRTNLSFFYRGFSLITNRDHKQAYATYVEYPYHQLEKIIYWLLKQDISNDGSDLSDWINKATLTTGVRKNFIGDE